LTQNAIVVNNNSSSTLAAVDGLVRAGKTSNWSGSGIITSAANATNLHSIGVADNAVAKQSSIFGQAVQSNAVIARYTWNGDANLDGVIGLPDYQKVDQGYVNAYTGWQNGDFNYDGVIGLPDYQLIDQAYVNQGSGLLGAAASNSGAVPEPASLGLLMLGTAALLNRRRRGQ